MTYRRVIDNKIIKKVNSEVVRLYEKIISEKSEKKYSINLKYGNLILEKWIISIVQENDIPTNLDYILEFIKNLACDDCVRLINTFDIEKIEK